MILLSGLFSSQSWFFLGVLISNFLFYLIPMEGNPKYLALSSHYILIVRVGKMVLNN